ncbi:MAG: putative ribosomal large subunit pseudouridine synthase [Pseudomonadota bacterium]|jgi:23S rRNA pseudouridine1911/1915/1917 synthase
MADNVHVIEHHGDEARLDKIIVEGLASTLMCSRSQVERWIEEGAASVNGKVVVKPAFKVSDGARIEVIMPSEDKTHLKPLDFPLEILFEDAHLIVLNKPAGISMHPGAGNDTYTIANAVVHHVGTQQLSVGESDRPGIVHRLDKDTTGVVVVAKSTPVHAALSRQFAERGVGRSYLALVYSTPRAVRAIQASDEGEVSAPIGRHPINRKMMMISDNGRTATTLWRVKERFPHGTLLECTLKTGRTHQIRVHMTSIGSPVIGDPAYGDFSNLPKPLRDAAALLGRQALHAATLSFTHPKTGERLSFSAAIPDDFQQLIAAFRGAQ